MNVYLRLTITDTLSVLVDGTYAFNPLAKVTRTFWYRLPGCWVSAGRLVPERRDHLIRLLYGRDGCSGDGNADGDRYVILELSEEILTDRQVARRPWLSDRAAFFAWREGDRIEKVIPASL